MKPLSSKARFEKWATRRKLPLGRMQEVTRDGPRWIYTFYETESAWQAWTAARRAFT